MKIDELTERRIKEAAKIVDIVGDFVKLRPKGQDFEGLCPFHDDHHYGSFKVNPRLNIFKCFACEKKGDPISFLRLQGMTYEEALMYIARKYSITIDTPEYRNYTPPKPVRKPEPPKDTRTMFTLPVELVKSRMHTANDPFCKWVRSLPWSPTQRGRLEQMLINYTVGSVSKPGNFNGWTIWWQIDEQGRVRTGKMMKYQSNGHRDKSTNSLFLHALMKRSRAYRYDESKQRVEQTLFGMHLLDFAPGASVNIVESEKTAVLCSIYFGNMRNSLWMACGGKSNLSSEKLNPIIQQGREINIFPDKDGIGEWKKICERIGYKRMSVNTYYIDKYWSEKEDGPHADIADIFVRQLQHPETFQSKEQAARPKRNIVKRTSDQDRLQAMINENPAVGLLVEKFNLEPIEGTI